MARAETGWFFGSSTPPDLIAEACDAIFATGVEKEGVMDVQIIVVSPEVGPFHALRVNQSIASTINEVWIKEPVKTFPLGKPKAVPQIMGVVDRRVRVLLLVLTGRHK